MTLFRSVPVVVTFCMPLPQCTIATLGGLVSGNLSTIHLFLMLRMTLAGGVELEQPSSAKDVEFTLAMCLMMDLHLQGNASA